MKNIIKLPLALLLCALLLVAAIPQSTLFAQGGAGIADEDEDEDEEDCVGAECDAEIVQDEDECVGDACGELDASPQDEDECAGDACGELEKEEKPKKDEPKKETPKKDEPKKEIPQVEAPGEQQEPKPSAPEPKPQVKSVVKPVEKVETPLSPEEKIEQKVEEAKKETLDIAQKEAQKSIEENKTETITKEIAEFKQELTPETAPEITPLINEIQKTLTTLPPPAEAAVTDSDNDTIVDSDDIDRFDPDNNNNGILDGLEFAVNSMAPTIIDTEDIQLQADVTAEVTKAVLTGIISQEKAPIIIKEEIDKKRAEKRDELIKKVAEKKYRTKIKTKEEQIKVYLAIDPKLPEKKDANFTRVEEKIYRLDLKKALKKIATNLRNGDKLSSKGTTILAACPNCKPGQELIIVVIDKKGRETKIGRGKFSDNHKAVIAIERPQLRSKEKYILQARLASRVTSYHGMLFASVLNEESAAPPESSEPVLVDIRDDEELGIPQPIVKSIEGIEVAGLRDIQISASADGKVRATGLVDASAMVVGNFSSAVFSSAILADVNSGTFEVVSPQQLEAGDHEVIIYATRPEEGSQSAPVRVRFSIIETAKAADGGALTQPPIVVVTHNAAPSKFPWVLVLGGIGVIVVLISIGIILKKRT